MGQRVQIELFDDIDGSTTDVQTLQFGLDGKAYEIDVTKDKVDKVREALAQLVEHARDANSTTSAVMPTGTSTRMNRKRNTTTPLRRQNRRHQ